MRSDDKNPQDVDLAQVHGGGLARMIAKGIGVGALIGAPILVPTALGVTPQDGPAIGQAVMGVSYGALAGWAVHAWRRIR